MSLDRGSNTVVEDKTVDIDQYPTSPIKADPKDHITVGDQHASALKLMYHLFKHGVWELEDQKAYEEMVRIYKTSVDWKSIEVRTIADLVLLPQRLLATDKLSKENLARFTEILKKIKTNKIANFLIIGDELADRGANDIFILLIMERLAQDGVPFTSLLSNHGLDFITEIQKTDAEIEANGGYHPTTFNPAQGPSLIRLESLVKRGLITRARIRELVEKYYLPNLKLLSYSLSEDKQHMTIYSHAAIDERVIKALAKKFNIPYKNEPVTELARTIDEINAYFQREYVQKNRVSELYDSDALKKVVALKPVPQGEKQEYFDFEKYPVEFIMWNRVYSNLNRAEKISGCAIDWVHGHDTNDLTTAKNVHNTDNVLAKGIDTHNHTQIEAVKRHAEFANAKGYVAIVSQQRPAPKEIKDSQLAASTSPAAADSKKVLDTHAFSLDPNKPKDEFEIHFIHPDTNNRIGSIRFRASEDELKDEFYSVWKQKIITQVQSTYGVTLEDEDFRQLKYRLSGRMDGEASDAIINDDQIVSADAKSLITLRLKSVATQKLCEKIAGKKRVREWSAELVAARIREIGQKWALKLASDHPLIKKYESSRGVIDLFNNIATSIEESQRDVPDDEVVTTAPVVSHRDDKAADGVRLIEVVQVLAGLKPLSSKNLIHELITQAEVPKEIRDAIIGDINAVLKSEPYTINFSDETTKQIAVSVDIDAKESLANKTYAVWKEKIIAEVKAGLGVELKDKDFSYLKYRLDNTLNNTKVPEIKDNTTPIPADTGTLVTVKLMPEAMKCVCTAASKKLPIEKWSPEVVACWLHEVVGEVLTQIPKDHEAQDDIRPYYEILSAQITSYQVNIFNKKSAGRTKGDSNWANMEQYKDELCDGLALKDAVSMLNKPATETSGIKNPMLTLLRKAPDVLKDEIIKRVTSLSASVVMASEPRSRSAAIVVSTDPKVGAGLFSAHSRGATAPGPTTALAATGSAPVVQKKK